MPVELMLLEVATFGGHSGFPLSSPRSGHLVARYFTTAWLAKDGRFAGGPTAGGPCAKKTRIVAQHIDKVRPKQMIWIDLD